MGAKYSSAAEFVLCLLQLELVRVVGAGREAAGAPPLRAPWVVVVGSPPLKFSTTGPRRNVGGEVSDRASGFFTTDGAHWVFCILKFKKRWGNKKSYSLPFKHSMPRGRRWYFCHNFPYSKY